MVSDFSPPCSPLLMSWAGVHPRIADHLGVVEAGAAVLGRTGLSEGSILRSHAVVRADGEGVTLGAGVYLGAHSTVHIAHELLPAMIGDRVSVGDYAVVHACQVGADAVVGDGAVILDGGCLGSGSILTTGSVIYPRHKLPDGFWCEGVPAKPIRAIEKEELRTAHQRVRGRMDDTKAGQRIQYLSAWDREWVTKYRRVSGLYQAPTVVGEGARLIMEEGSSLWFGCVLLPGEYEMSLGAGSNIQDNSVLCAVRGSVRIGANSSIGHNVYLDSCQIGSEVLIGIGSSLAGGTIVEDDVLLAAGATTEEGQVLKSGYLWGGSPARVLACLDQDKRAMIKMIPPVYRQYAAEYYFSEWGRHW